MYYERKNNPLGYSTKRTLCYTGKIQNDKFGSRITTWLYCYFGWIFPPERNQSVFMETKKHAFDVSNFPPI